MSAFWASDPLRRPAAALAFALLLLAAPAAAGIHVSASTSTDSGGIVTHVRVDGRHIDVVGGGSHPARVTIDDSLGRGAIVVDGGAGLVRLFSDATVKAGDHVDGDVVAVFGSVHVAGSVGGSVVAVLGSVDFSPGAEVGGDAVAVGGAVGDTQGARVNGQTVSVGFMPLTLGLPALPTMLSFLALGWLVTVFFGWIFGALFPVRLARVAATASRRTAASLVLGLLSGPAAPVLAVLLMVTVVGLPLGVLLPLIYVAVVYAGQIAALHLLGCKLVRRGPGEGGPLGPIVAGSAFVGMFFVVGTVLWTWPGAVRTVGLFFHLVGLMILAALSAVGTGAFLLSRAGSRPTDIGASEPAGSGAPSAPPATPGATPVAG